MFQNITAIGFDADDTLWANETFFHDTEHAFCELFAPAHTEADVRARLLAVERANIHKYGYGSKAFMLSMIETALQFHNGQIPSAQIEKILSLGNHILTAPRTLLDGVETTLQKIHASARYKLLLITKGDLVEQSRKIRASGLQKYFAHTEIIGEKDDNAYADILRRHAIAPAEFLMVGNSLRSDIDPALKLGARGVYIPFHVTWAHEHMNAADLTAGHYVQLEKITELPKMLSV